jgi:hypothetical protein
MNNTERELDLFSGRVRTTRYFMWMHVGRHVEQTPVSKALGDDANRQERWVRTATFQPFHRVSPQYIHGRDPVAINHLASIWENHGFTPGARQKTARQLLRLLRGANVSAAKTWLDGLYELSENRCPDQPVTAADIPDVLAEEALSAGAEDHQPNTSQAD